MLSFSELFGDGVSEEELAAMAQPKVAVVREDGTPVMFTQYSNNNDDWWEQEDLLARRLVFGEVDAHTRVDWQEINVHNEDSFFGFRDILPFEVD